MGESEKSRPSSLSTEKSGGIIAAVGNFHATIQTKWHVNVDLPCIISGSPTPNVKWTYENQIINLQSRRFIYDNYTLHLETVTSSDSGNYTCSVWNVYGSENVTTSLIVVEPPKPPTLDLVNVSWTNITLNWTRAPDSFAVQQYLLSYKYIYDLENVFNEISFKPQDTGYTLTNIKCSTTVSFSISAGNRVGHGIQSRPLRVTTLQGKSPTAPRQNEAIEQMMTGFLIHLQKWSSQHCPITHFAVFKRLSTEKEWIPVNENITSNTIYSVESLNPSTSYDILIKCVNSAGVTSSIFTASTLRDPNVKGITTKEPVSVNEKIMHTIYSITVMWPAALAVVSLIFVCISLIICYKYRHLYKKNQRNVEANNTMLENNAASKTEVHSDAYETCVPFKSKSTISTNEDPNYNEISPYATFQISPSKSPKMIKQYFCTKCGEDLELCNCNKIYCSQVDYSNFLRRPIPTRQPSYSENNHDDSENNSIHGFYDIERNSKTCEPMKKPKRRLLPLPDARRGSHHIPRECRSANLHETTFMMPIQHQQHHRMCTHNDADDEGTGMSSGRGSRYASYRMGY
ncbi:Fibronectin type III,Immunoglobulin subtype,Immunoglobulin-like domain,Immunoglobulin-like [Cinara cedri]|uniref:Fibronectin type III,Immunoglobulin subtype,Immunoglobulin-like domain,Immunoglobulin-like n=1 Tax=Cinara cedri TaxID=506608 RepID=A0A5E4NSY6_9HEMI|nr:Fibronectin type III,Immunoglobulin subtype,Immunoglobulin-like domain,Immunoglobulin-like [Cinara cedri]